jgi:ABC-type polysaccharide transport system permease subunit
MCMAIWYIIGYFVVGYIAALAYYVKCDTVDGEKVERRQEKAVTLFFVWPLITVLAILITPFVKHDEKRSSE